MTGVTHRQPEPIIRGEQLGYWLELALMTVVSGSFFPIIIQTCRYFNQHEFLENDHSNPGLNGSRCPAGFVAQKVYTAGCQRGTCVSDLGWTLRQGPRLTYLLLGASATGLVLALVRRARDAGVAVRWPSSRPTPPSEETAGGPIRASHPKTPATPNALPLAFLAAIFQIVLLLWRVATAPPLAEPFPTCDAGDFVVDFSGPSVRCYGPGTVGVYVVLQIGLALLVLPLAWLANALLP